MDLAFSNYSFVTKKIFQNKCRKFFNFVSSHVTVHFKIYVPYQLSVKLNYATFNFLLNWEKWFWKIRLKINYKIVLPWRNRRNYLLSASVLDLYFVTNDLKTLGWNHFRNYDTRWWCKIIYFVFAVPNTHLFFHFHFVVFLFP